MAEDKLTKEIEDRFGLMIKLSQFEDINIPLTYKAVGKEAVEFTNKMAKNDIGFIPPMETINGKKEYVWGVPYKGADENELRKLFDRLYENEKLRFPSFKKKEFLKLELEWFGQLCEKIKSEYRLVINGIMEFLKDEIAQLESPQQSETKTEQRSVNQPPQKLISFTDSKTIDSLFDLLKGYFPERGNDLKDALLGIELQTRLLFPHNQNKFVEVFRRAKYNGKILSSPTEIKNWLCTNFEYRYKLGAVENVKSFNASTVWDILTKGKSIPPPKERICLTDWLPFKSKEQLDKEAKKENL